MSWDSVSDAMAATSAQVFGAAITYTPRHGEPAPGRGVFEAVYTEASLIDGVLVEETSPALGVLRFADLPAMPQQDDEVELADGRRFRVTNVRPDGAGGALLRLEEA